MKKLLEKIGLWLLKVSDHKPPTVIKEVKVPNLKVHPVPPLSDKPHAWDFSVDGNFIGRISNKHYANIDDVIICPNPKTRGIEADNVKFVEDLSKVFSTEPYKRPKRNEEAV